MSPATGAHDPGYPAGAGSVPDIPPPFAARTGGDVASVFPELDVLSALIAIVDQSGRILRVNHAWRDFAASYALPGQNIGEGANYFDVCAIEIPADAAEIAAGIQAVIAGERKLFTRETRWHAPDQELWFTIRVTRLPDDRPPWAMVVHEDISGRKLAEVRTEQLARERAARVEAEATQQRLAFLAGASALLAGSLEYETTLARIPSLLVPQLADWCSIHLMGTQNRLTPVAYSHSDPAKVDPLRPLVYDYPPNLAWATHPVAVALRTRQPQLIARIPEGWAETVATDARHLQLLRLLGQTSLMILPLTARDQLLGAMILAWTQPGRSYNATDLAFAGQVAERAALAIDNARLYAAAQEARAAAETAQLQANQRTVRMQALAEAGYAFAEVLHDPTAALEHITRYIAELMGDLCVVRLLSDDGKRLEAAALHHPDPEALEMLRAIAPLRLQVHTNRLYSPVLASGEPRLVEPASMEEMRGISREEFWPFYDRYGIHNVLIAPLRVRGRVTGTVAVFRRATVDAFTPVDRTFLQALADRAALAVENARLYRAVQAQRAHLQAVLDTIPEAVILCRVPDGQMVEGNRAALEFAQRMGVTADGKGLSTLRYTRRDGEPFLLDQLPAMRAARGETVVGVEITISSPPDKHAVILAGAAPVLDDRGDITSAVLVFQDITERKTLEQMKDDFMSLAAHELRTPLTVLIGQSQLMARRLRNLLPSRDAVQELTGVDAQRMMLSLQDILDGARDMSRLVNELLDLSRIETGRLELKPQPADLADLLRRVVERHRQLHPDRYFGMEGGDTPAWGMWDAGRLEQVFTNLLENAAKYSPGGGPVVLRMAAAAKSVQVTVQDWGIGIPAGDLPRIFDRHYRAGNVGRASTGLGLGLYLTQQLVELHGGAITVESAEGEGSTFTVTLPLDGPPG